MKFTIDRFEGDIAIIELENGKIIDIPNLILPSNSKEGDIISIKIDKKETEKRQQRIKNKFNILINNKDEDSNK